MESGAFEKPSTDGKRRRRMVKMVATVTVVLVVIAALAGAVAAINGGTINRENSYDKRELSQTMEDMIADYHSSQTENTRVKRQGYTYCESEVNNETVPTAHIAGYKTWKKIASDSSTSGVYVPGYISSWKCIGNNGGPFVDGGMKFDNNLKALIVPTCGYYYISSSVTFLAPYTSAKTQPTTMNFFHKLRIIQECPNTARHQVEAIGYAATNKGRVTSHVEQIVRLCENSQVQVIIPNTVPCCGVGLGSYINSFLVEESNCTTGHARKHAMTIY